MKRFFELSLLIIIAVVMSVTAVSGQETLTIGDSSTVTSVTERPTFVELVLEAPAFVTITAAPVDGTLAPYLGILDGERELIIAGGDDGTGARIAIVRDVFLLAGVYRIGVQSGLATGSESIQINISEGDGGALGTGQVEIITDELGAGEVFSLRATLNAGELITFMVIADNTDDLDTQLTLFDSNGRELAENDDYERFEPILGDFDSMIERFIVPETGEYGVEVSGFSSSDAGVFRLVVRRFGVLDTANAVVETFSGESPAGARNSFLIAGEAGEIWNLTANAISGTFDPELFVLDPDLIYLARNDDHNLEDSDLPELSSLVTGLLLNKTGDYVVEVNNLGGDGAFELIIERGGRLQPQTFTPIDPTNVTRTVTE